LLNHRYFVVAAALICAAPRASAQIAHAAPAAGTAQVISVNVLLGALTAGAWSAAQRRPFWPAFARGAGAGATVYLGKKLIGEGNPASWWGGRELAALGSSEVVNAAQGAQFLERAVIPIGPIRFHLDRRAKRKIVPKLDLAASIATVVIASQERTRFALKESLATGVLVFVAPETSETVGSHTAGVVTVSELLPDGNFPPLPHKREVISHEMIHAVQNDFTFTVWSDVTQRAIAKTNPLTRFVSRYIDVNVTLPLQLGLNRMIDYADRPWEKEAVAFANPDR